MNIARIFSIDPVQDGRDQEGVADLKNNKPLVNPKNEQEKGVREIGAAEPTEEPLRNPKNESGLRVAYPKNEQEKGFREIGTNVPTNEPLTNPKNEGGLRVTYPRNEQEKGFREIGTNLWTNLRLTYPKNEQEKGVREIGTKKPTKKPLTNPKNEGGLRVAYPKNEQEKGVREIGTADLGADPLRTPPKWITSDILAPLAEVSERMIRKAFKNGKYRGTILDVRTIESERGGGASGIVRQVHVDSLPHDLRSKYYLQFGIDIDARKVAGITASIANLEHEYGVDPSYDNARADAIWRKTIIDPILKAPARSKERAETIGRISREGVIGQDGLHQSITKVTLYGWVKKYEASGLHGLIRKKRNDAKRRRVIVNKKYDAFFLPYIGNDHLQCVSQEIRHYIRGLWAAGSTGWRAVSEQSATKLIEISSLLDVPEFNVLEKGRASDGAKALTQFGICHISRRMAEQERRYRLLAIKNKDNARLQDKYAATIKRDYRV